MDSDSSLSDSPNSSGGGGKNDDERIKRTESQLLVKVTREEKLYREKSFVGISKTFNANLRCTVCEEDLYKSIMCQYEVDYHPHLQVLLCKECLDYYDDGNFKSDDDGWDRFCRWCSQGGKLFCCESCTCVFCEKCIKRNLDSSVLEDLQKDEWKCFVCEPEPLYECRAICWAAIQYCRQEKHKLRLKREAKLSVLVDERNQLSKIARDERRNKRKVLIEKNSNVSKNVSSSEGSSDGNIEHDNIHHSEVENSDSDSESEKKADKKLKSEKHNEDQKVDANGEEFRENCGTTMNDIIITAKTLVDRVQELKRDFGETLPPKRMKELRDLVNDSAESLSKILSNLEKQLISSEKNPFQKNTNRKNNDKARSSDHESDFSESPAEHAIKKLKCKTDPKDDSDCSLGYNDEVPATLKKEHDSSEANDGLLRMSEHKEENKVKAEKCTAESEPDEKKSEGELKKAQLLLPSDSDDSAASKELPRRSLKKRKNSSIKKQLSLSKTQNSSMSRKFPKKKLLRDSSESNSESEEIEEETEMSHHSTNLKKEKKSGFKIENLEIYKKDEKLRMKCTVDIVKMETNYVGKDKKGFDLDSQNSHEEDSEDDIRRLTNFSNLKKRIGRPSKACKSSPPKNKEAKKKVEVKLMDFFGAKSDDYASGLESSQELSSDLFEVGPKEDFYKKLLCSSSDSDDEYTTRKEELEKPKSKTKKVKVPKAKVDTDSKKDVTSDKDESDSAKSRSDKSDEDIFIAKKKSNWRKDKLLCEKLSDTDTSDDERRLKNKKKIKKEEELSVSKIKSPVITRKKNKLESLSTTDDEGNNSSSDDFVKKKKKVQEKVSSDSVVEEEDSKKKKVYRKRIREMKSSGSSSDEEEANSSQNKSPNKGRKKIRRVLGETDLMQDTKEAAKEEEERRRRISDRNKRYSELYEDLQKKAHSIDKLILEFDEETNTPRVSVHESIAKKLKPHQAEGVKFMWDACYESLERIKKSSGSGCILAHCMGLGKSLQVVALVHTLLSVSETEVKRVLIVCPLSTISNWVNEFDKWLSDVEDDDTNIHEITRSSMPERQHCMKYWMQVGGVMILSYDMFRNLSNPVKKNIRSSMSKTFQEALLDPGPDLVICDEGHILKNEDTAIAKAMNRIRSLRRIVLTGTPLQNNLKEYHCMVQFVKRNLLGTRKEFLNRFVNPITNGQFEDSTPHDVRTMKRRAHVLHKTLEGCVQRYDYSVLTPFLPPKHEYALSVQMTELQETLYQHYLENYSGRNQQTKGAKLFADFQYLQRIWTHPRALLIASQKREQNEDEGSDSEGSLVDFIDDGSEKSDTSSDDNSKSDSSAHSQNKVTKRRTRASAKNMSGSEPELELKDIRSKEWWDSFVTEDDLDDMRLSPKFLLLFSFLKQCEESGEKLLVFSQSIVSLDLIEYFLMKVDEATQKNLLEEKLNNHQGSWSKGLDYFRMDGSTPADIRTANCKSFNNTANHRARLYIISTRAGGLGINLVAANRVIIFDASWNPSHDLQSIFRIYRFGQKSPCFIYRFLARGTMEERIYERQITKLSLACRVVDEQQIERHYNMSDLQELYQFTPADRSIIPLHKLPKDHVLAEILKLHEVLIANYHEHDTLLENKEEEELNEEERQAAWDDYENEKKGVQNNFQRMNVLPDLNSSTIEMIKISLRSKYPEKTEDELYNLAIALLNMNSLQTSQSPYYPYQQAPYLPQSQMPAQVQNNGMMTAPITFVSDAPFQSSFQPRMPFPTQPRFNSINTMFNNQPGNVFNNQSGNVVRMPGQFAPARQPVRFPQPSRISSQVKPSSSDVEVINIGDL